MCNEKLILLECVVVPFILPVFTVFIFNILMYIVQLL